MYQGYHTKLDATDELNQEGLTTSQELIEILLWEI